MKTIGRFLLAHWKMVLFLIGAVLLFLTGRFREGSQLLLALQTEKKALDAAKKAEMVAADQGHAAAIEQIQTEHAATIAKLDTEQTAQAEKLAADPAALSSFLVKAAHK